MRQALSDLRVIELGTGVAASWCGKSFADLGADVVKVEPPGGDPMRSVTGRFAHLNTNKSSVVLERSAAGADDLWALLEAADLVIEAPRQGSLADWGIDRQDVLARVPGGSVVAITGWGTTGPYAELAWSDLVAQAFSGAYLSDYTRGPVKLPMSVAECGVGHTAALGGLAAVLRARATGQGAFVDVSAVEALSSPPARIQRFLGWAYRLGAPLDAAAIAATAGRSLMPNGVFPCADGHVALMMTTQQLPAMLQVLDSPELNEAFARPDAFAVPETKEVLDGALYSFLLQRTRAEVTAAAQAAGWPATGVNVPNEVLDADHLHQRGFWVHAEDPELGRILLPGAPYRLTEGGWKLRRPAPRLGEDTPPTPRADRIPAGPKAPTDPAEPPLRGIRVLDITTVYSGPFLTLLLSDLGAEVIRVESPLVFPPTTRGLLPRPDPNMMLGGMTGSYGPQAPGRPDRPWNRHAMYNSINRGKRSVSLDVREPEQRDLFFQLVAESDIFVENLKASTLHQMGIHETQLLEANPRMIVLRIPPAGLSGDWSHYKGFGAQFDGLTGFASLCGHQDAELVETPPTMHMDSVTGPAGAFALLAALHHRDATGRGQVIELAQSENVIAQLGDVYLDVQRGIQPQRLGNRDPHQAPQGFYRCADGGWVGLTVTSDTAWPALAKLLGRDDLAGDVALAAVAGRYVHHDALDEAISHWTSTVGTYEAFEQLQAAGIAASPAPDDEQFAADPQVAARQFVRPLASSDVGPFDHLGHAYQGIPLDWTRGAPTFGEDNEYVFKDILGLTDDEYAALVAKGIAVEHYVDRNGNPY
jgi:crotonobetainyl-CoA:carnitine CoA-transferase CaiB-like acyl-CoA transferase